MQAPLIIALLGLTVSPCGTLRLQPSGVRSPEDSSDVDALDFLYDVQEYQNLVAQKSGDSIHKRMERQRLTTHKTICINGKSLPVFYLIGGQKTLSTSVAASLAQAGVVWDGPKELRVFCQSDSQGYYDFPGQTRFHDWKPVLPERLFEENLQESIDTWTNSEYSGRAFPACGEEHGAVADMTPNYFSAPNITDALWRFYGESAKNLTFMIVLREPLARMHSAYHYTIHTRGAGHYAAYHGQEYNEPEFSGFLDWSREKFQTPGQNSDALDNSLYGRAIQKFLKAGFSASQFVIVPPKAYNDDVGSVVRAVAEKLGTSPLPKIKLEPNHANLNWRHPSMDHDIEKFKHHKDEELRYLYTRDLEIVQRILEKDFETLVTQLAEGQPKGMSLVGFQGEAGSSQDIEQWLRTSW